MYLNSSEKNQGAVDNLIQKIEGVEDEQTDFLTFYCGRLCD